MMVGKQIMLPETGEKTLEETSEMNIASMHLGINPTLLASLAGPNVHGTSSLGSLNSMSSANFPLGYQLGLRGGIPPSLQVQLLMGRSLMNPFSGLPISHQNHLHLSQSALAHLAPGIQALQGNTSKQSCMPNKESGIPIANEIKEALATLAASAPAVMSAPIKTTSTGTLQASLPVVVFMECDEESLSDYQCMLRKQIELFEASAQDVQWNAQGRNKPIVLGQVGIRCRWCATLPTWSRSRGAVYYSASLDGLYQAAQNMAKNHICKNCRYIPAVARQELSSLRECKRRAAGGKKYWAEGAKVLGIYECEDGLRFKNSNIPVPPRKCIETVQ